MIECKSLLAMTILILVHQTKTEDKPNQCGTSVSETNRENCHDDDGDHVLYRNNLNVIKHINKPELDDVIALSDKISDVHRLKASNRKPNFKRSETNNILGGHDLNAIKHMSKHELDALTGLTDQIRDEIRLKGSKFKPNAQRSETNNILGTHDLKKSRRKPTIIRDDQDTKNEEDNNEMSDADFYEYPKLTRIDTGTLGERTEIELEPGQIYTRITKSLTPPIFEIPDFLTPSECDSIISKARDVGMTVSSIHGGDSSKQLKAIGGGQNLSDIHRVSQTAWLFKKHLTEEAMLKLRKRVSKLTQAPFDVIERSEAVQVVNYNFGGHYHAHPDSTNPNTSLPCCFQANCSKHTKEKRSGICCTLCRYITVMLYLNDVEEGGETAFPVADMDKESIKVKTKETKGLKNLSKNCHKAALVVTPEKGKAVMWYNHESDDKGYLGKTVIQSIHGGCDVIRGSKWIANFWINWPVYESRFEKSIHL